ncbi:hypothetical protein [Sporosarcina ureilytica]|uniref:C4-dicarboxylate ABC transporter n=1 Tax=Sporosarcina ureilytica TaxID=298596 RepID=A0A1D8JE15_9BACL|nr:hypothetical protein [Sporosarcina ureilytica]AOV06923.1 hypothetical protein BI350_04635 [Sporosarcina ureilytica]
MLMHWGFWTGWLGITLAVFAFFFDPALGGVAIMLGLITFVFPKKMLASFSIGLGVIALLLQHI